jgi:hypothetical protein
MSYGGHKPLAYIQIPATHSPMPTFKSHSEEIAYNPANIIHSSNVGFRVDFSSIEDAMYYSPKLPTL